MASRLDWLKSPFAMGAMAGLVVVAIGLVWLMGGFSFGGKPKGSAAETDPFAEGADDGSRDRTVEIVFLDAATGEWKRADSSISLPSDDANRLRVITQEWLDRTVPTGQKVRVINAFVDERYHAYLNLSEAFRQGFVGGVTAEMEVLTGLAKTLEANFPNIRDVQILVEGRPIQSLGGQFDISLPISVSYFAQLR